MNHVGLFEGSGIPSYLAGQAGFRTVAWCEQDEFCQQWLRELLPDAHGFDDVRNVSGESLRRVGVERVTLLTGGFPCQNISCAGKGEGLSGEKSGLYWELSRIIRDIRPDWILLENVPALRTRGADEVLADLEDADYAVWPVVAGAWSCGLPHKRDRVWIVGHDTRKQADAGRPGGEEVEESIGVGQRGRRDGDERELRREIQTAGSCTSRGEALADAMQPVREERHTPAESGEAEQREPVRGIASPGEQQHDHAYPRLVGYSLAKDIQGNLQPAERFGYSDKRAPWTTVRPVGGATHGVELDLHRRANKELLRVCGNGWATGSEGGAPGIIIRWIAERINE